MSEDEELERIKKKKLEEMMQTQKENKDEQVQERKVLDLDNSNFDQVVSQNTLVLVDFWAEWCGPCKMMHPVFDRMAKKYNNIQFARINVDNNQTIAQRFGVQAIPTFIMFQNGQAAERMMGAVGEPGIYNVCEKFS